ncbi:DUF4956 domain-containing protein [Sedimentibacter sp. zth1]|uniref:DUF4956 domain-containing protein n=1 Tax=Sedimentibacter sp. zth1 TaxID=2816908 RepID=UPI001A9124D2|nr:DUF4956 domain-containing protein [Sedimentibacter sp. zth1]QSX05775.1 DUF4956 domain-containing protein [Sedimentibacter sp. zth1]
MNKENLIDLLINGTKLYTIENIIFNFSITVILAFFIYLVYKKTNSSVVYSQNFNLTIVMIALISSLVMMLIGNNLAISLGMVGALSIVRFRAAIKEPRDIAFLFWAIAIGLASGSGAFLIAIIGSIIIAIVLFLFSKTAYSSYSYLLIIKGNNLKCECIQDVLRNYKIPNKMCMKNTSLDSTELTYEMTLKQVNKDNLIEHFFTIKDITEVHIVSYNGEVSG